MKLFVMIKYLFISTFALVVILLFSTVHAGGWNTNKDNVVLEGYDVVAYHTMAQAVKGTAMLETTYDGARFFFANAANQKLFNENPRKYLPKYKGYCAFAVAAKNAKVPANPDTFKIYNGELLVFFNDHYEGQKFNTKVPWNADERNMFNNAEQNWLTRWHRALTKCI